MKNVYFLLIILPFFIGCIDRRIDEFVSSMTNEEKAGQLFMVGNLGNGLLSEELYSSLSRRLSSSSSSELASQ